MTETMFRWPVADEFLNRSEQLERIEQWWNGRGREPLAMLGRRRVGKSWLFRKFANGKPALILVAEQLPPGAMMSRFADELTPILGVRPEIDSLSTLISVLYRIGHDNKILVVIDEFPYLLGTTSAEQQRALSGMQAVLEAERDASETKLVLCGSQVAQMESLFSTRGPLHGRLERLDVRPLDFDSATHFFTGLAPIASFERFAVTGGMPMYLSRMATGSLGDAVCGAVLDRDAPLFAEGRTLVEQELREPRTYFGILSRLAGGPSRLDEIATGLRLEATSVSKYLQTLEGLRLVSRSVPFGAGAAAKRGHWQLDDPFLRFWFRFVFPFQADLESGLVPTALFDQVVAPAIADHVSPVFENWCVTWLRSNRADVATSFGRWWGNAANRYRRTKERTTEEIDAVGAGSGNKITLVSEAKWTSRKMGPQILSDLRTYKIPALEDAGFRVADSPRIVLFSKSGYNAALERIAAEDPNIELVDVTHELSRRDPSI